MKNNGFISKMHQYVKTRFLNDELPMENRLSNLIMLCTAVGCLLALAMSMVVNQDVGTSVMVSIAFVVVCVCLYLSAWKRRPKLAAVVVILLINEVIFPVMFITSGGIHSGMICWLLVGLIFPFLTLNGWICTGIFLLGMVTLGGLFLVEYFGLVTVKPLEGIGWVEDAVQSMVIVALIFGIIFKFQSMLYKRQNEDLIEHEKQLQDTLRQLEFANNAKSDFLANMSHEIRTPINAIMGMNEIILRDTKDENVIKNSNNIQTASENLLTIVNNILDFSKIESGNMEIITSDYMLSSLMNDCYNMINLRASNKGLKFVVENNPDIPENLIGDEFHIRQIVTNFLTNAVKYTKEGSVTLKADYETIDEKNVYLIFSVIDTGQGISEKDKEKLFVSFQRLDEKYNRTIEGTGLGLTITKRLADLMGGSVSVESEAGKGSVFTVKLPQTVRDDIRIGEFSKRYEEYQKKTTTEYKEMLVAPECRILVVDDVKMNLTVVKGLLKKTQIQIDTALSGKEGYEKSCETKYDVILLDHMMPEMDGIETFRKIRESGNMNFATPIIVLTANAIKGAEEEYLSVGFDAYLSKPMHGEELERMLLRFLPKK